MAEIHLGQQDGTLAFPFVKQLNSGLPEAFKGDHRAIAFPFPGVAAFCDLDYPL